MPVSQRKLLGAWYTPPALVDAVVAELRRGFSPRSVLDPACGDGRFLAPFTETAAVTGIDIDPATSWTCGDALAIDWAEKGVRVNTVAPGYMETDLTSLLQHNEKLSGKVVAHTPLGRFGKPEEIVGACLYLASSASSYVTGQSLRVDGGFTAS